VTFRDRGIIVLRFVHIEIVSHLAQRLQYFSLAKKLAKHIVFVLGQQTSHTGSKNLKVLPLLGRKLLKFKFKYLEGVRTEEKLI
jgi:hypothetical protein